jgi:hypothetical protein
VIIISGVAAAVIVGLAISIHLRLSAVEPEGHRENETPQEVMNEILTGQPAAHTEESGKSEEGHIEESEKSVHIENEESPEAEENKNR